MPTERNRDAEQLLVDAADRHRVARDELSAAAVDLFLPPERRLTDQQRAVMNDLLAKLMTGIELEIRQYLAESLLQVGGRSGELATMLGDERLRIAAPGKGSGEFGDLTLVERLLWRTEEHLIALGAPEAEPPMPSGTDVVEILARNPDAELARRAVAYVVGQAKRRDRLQEPLLLRDELPVELAYRLHWHIAAELRRHLLRSHVVEATDIDRAMEDAVRRAMADHDEGQGVSRRAIRLAARLNELRELDDALLVRLLVQGHPALFAAGLATRAAVGLDIVWRALLDRARHSLLALLRAINVSQDDAASILSMLDAVHPPVWPPAATRLLLAAYADLDAAGAQRIVRSWQLDPGYRDAIASLER